MTVTLAQIRSEVQERLQDPNGTSISAASVDGVINDSINYYKNRHYWFNEASTNITLTASDPVVPSIPSDFLVELPVGGLTLSYAAARYPLQKITSQLYDNMNYQGNGLPRFYVYRNSNFELYFYPDRDYTLVLRYLKDYTALSADGDNNDFTNNAGLMIRYDALSRLYAEYKQDEKMEAYYTAKRDDEERNLLRRSNHNTGSGTLTKQSYLLT